MKEACQRAPALSCRASREIEGAAEERVARGAGSGVAGEATRRRRCLRPRGRSARAPSTSSHQPPPLQPRPERALGRGRPVRCRGKGRGWSGPHRVPPSPGERVAPLSCTASWAASSWCTPLARCCPSCCRLRRPLTAGGAQFVHTRLCFDPRGEDQRKHDMRSDLDERASDCKTNARIWDSPPLL